MLQDNGETLMAIIRSARPDSGFYILQNAVAEDERLSFRARGVLIALLVKPDDWRCTTEELEKQGTEGREAIRTALRELEAAGYLERVRSQDSETGKWSTDVYVHDTRGTANRSTGSRTSVTRPSVDRTLIEEPIPSTLSSTDVPSEAPTSPMDAAKKRSYRGPKRGDSYSPEARSLAGEIWESLTPEKRPSGGPRSNGFSKVLHAVGAGLSNGRTENQIRKAILEAAPLVSPNAMDMAYKKTLSAAEQQAADFLQRLDEQRERLLG